MSSGASYRTNSGYKIKSGSVEVAVTSGSNTQVIKATGAGTAYTCKLPTDLPAGSTAEVRVTFVPGVQSGAGSGAGGKSTVSAGVSVSVGVVKNTIKAEVKNANIKAAGLTVKASSETTGTVEALAGYSQGDIGIGGAVAVNVGKAKTNAKIYKTATLELSGGNLGATASSVTAFATKGDAQGKDTSKSAGVGAGIAVQVTGIETIAEIEDGTKVTIGDPLSGIEFSAVSKDTQTVAAAAGSAGGISITPVLSLLVTGTETKAHIGKLGKVIDCTGDAIIKAESDITRTLTADASATGGSVAVGGSFAISVLKDVTNAKLSSGVNTRNLSVTTKARNRTTSTSKASANGASSGGSGDSSSGSGSSDSDPDGEQKSESDKQADGMLSGAGKLSSHVNAGGTNPSSVRGSANGRQGASTSEGSIDVAAAFTLNIQNISVKAEIDPGLAVKAKAGDGGAIIVQSLAKNEALITANGSASNGKIGVGVAVSINIVNYENIAVIGDSAVDCVSLTLEAGMIKADKGEGSNDSAAPDTQYGWLMDLLYNAVKDLVKDIANAVGFGDIFGENAQSVIADMITEAVDAAKDELLKGTGFEQILESNPYEKVQENLRNFVNMFLSIPDKLKETAESLLVEPGPTVMDRLKAVLLNYLKTEAWPVVQDAILSNIVQVVKPMLGEFLNPTAPGQEIPEDSQLGQRLKDAFIGPNGILIAARDKIVDDILAKVAEVAKEYSITIPDREHLNAEGFKKAVTDSLKAIALKVGGTLTDGICDINTFKNFIKSGEIGTKLKENLINALKEAGKALTNAAIDELTGLLGVKVEVEDVPDSHTFTTDAIAGAGGAQAAVAGSVAIAVIHGTTSAALAGTKANSQNYVIVKGALTVHAEGNQIEKTTASAAEDSRGKANANLNAGQGTGVAGANGEQTTAPSVIKPSDISNANITISAGGKAEVDEREVTLVPDQGMKLRKVTVTYENKDGVKSTLEVPVFSDNKFTVPVISSEGTEVQITLAGRAVRVKAGSTLEYRVIFVSESTQSVKDADLVTEGSGSGELTAGNLQGAVSEGMTEQFYYVKAKPDTGYELEDKAIVFNYIGKDGKPASEAIISDDLFSDTGFRFSIERKKDDKDNWTTKLIMRRGAKEVEIKDGSIVTAELTFISKLTLSVKTVKKTSGADKIEALGAVKKEQNSDKTWTVTYQDKESSGGTLRGTVKLLNVTAAKDGADPRAVYEDRIAVVVKPADGYKLAKLYIKYKVKVNGQDTDKTQDLVTTDSSIVDPDGGTTYLFYLPDASTEIFAIFEKETEPAPQQQEQQKNQSGKTIGAGAGFAMTYSDLDVTAVIGENRTVSAGTADLRAESIHSTQTSGVAGTDPLAGASTGTQSQTAKDVSLDASVAVTVVKDTVEAQIGRGAKVTVTGKDEIAVDPEDPDTKFVSFILSAYQEGNAVTKASSFAAGKSTAVGASVTINITSSDVKAILEGDVTAAGSANLSAKTHNRDDSEALATAMGADLDRYMNKFAGGVQSTEETANKLLSGEYFSGSGNNNNNNDNNNNGGKKGGQKDGDTDDKKPNDTQQRIMDTLTENKNGEGEATDPDKNANLSSNALKTQAVKGESSEKATSVGNQGIDEANKNKSSDGQGKKGNRDGSNQGGNNSPENQTMSQSSSTQSQNFQVAAAVGLNITKHKANTELKGSITAGGDITVTAENRGNFLTKGTGIAMSLARNSNSIAAGVSVSVDKNEATVKITGSVISKPDKDSNTGDVSITAHTTQNMDGKYKGLLAAQSLAGAVSGEGKVSIAGSVSVVVDDAVTKVEIVSNEAAPAIIKGGRITIEAKDKTKLAIRAGGISVSKGSNVGVGVAFAMIYANNAINVEIGDYAQIFGSSIVINAEKTKVDFSDFESAIDLTTFITDTSDLDPADKGQADKGFINLDKDKTDPNATYTVDINVTTENAIGLVDALNVLSSQNYYAEAIAGSIMGSGSGGEQSKLNIAGSAAVVVFRNKVSATIGEHALICASGCTYRIYEDTDGNIYYVLDDTVYS